MAWNWFRKKEKAEAAPQLKPDIREVLGTPSAIQNVQEEQAEIIPDTEGAGVLTSDTEVPEVVVQESTVEEAPAADASAEVLSEVEETPEEALPEEPATEEQQVQEENLVDNPEEIDLAEETASVPTEEVSEAFSQEEAELPEEESTLGTEAEEIAEGLAEETEEETAAAEEDFTGEGAEPVVVSVENAEPEGETEAEQAPSVEEAPQAEETSAEEVPSEAEKPKSALAQELATLWGLEETPEEAQRRIRHERQVTRGKKWASFVAVLLLLGFSSAGVFAYQQGWRLNLFYEASNPVMAQVPEETPAEELAEEEPYVYEPVNEGYLDRELVAIQFSRKRTAEELVKENTTVEVEEPDKVTVTETGPVQTVEVERASNAYLTVDGSTHEIRFLESEVASVGDLLAYANITLSEEDIVEPGLSAPVSDGSSVKVIRVVVKEYTTTEAILGTAIERLTPVLRVGRTEAIGSGEAEDGEREVTYRETYFDGQLQSKEELASTVTKEASDYTLLVGADIAASPINGSTYTDVQIVGNVPSSYEAVYSGKCTAYNFRQGVYGASGMSLYQGMVAVDPSIIPYGSLLYITSDNFVYGWAIAADYCEAAAQGRVLVDCFFETYRESQLFGAKNLTVYVVKQLYQADLAKYIGQSGMFYSRIPA